MNYDKIQAALETKLATVVDIPDIAYENTKYDPTTGVPYVKTRFLPTDRSMKVLGVDDDNKPFWQEYHGLFQLILNMPEGTGSKPTNDLVRNIMNVYETATDLSFNGVYVTVKKVERTRGYNETPWFKTSVNVYWYSHSK